MSKVTTSYRVSVKERNNIKFGIGWDTVPSNTIVFDVLKESINGLIDAMNKNKNRNTVMGEYASIVAMFVSIVIKYDIEPLFDIVDTVTVRKYISVGLNKSVIYAPIMFLTSTVIMEKVFTRAQKGKEVTLAWSQFNQDFLNMANEIKYRYKIDDELFRRICEK